VIVFDTQDYELIQHGELAYAFPLHEQVGTASTAAVLFEVAPHGALATHTDSAEETLVVLSGECEATVGDETGLLRAGQVAVVPASVPHAVRNLTDEPLRVLGIFTSATILSIFGDDSDSPQLLVNGAPIATPAAVAA